MFESQLKSLPLVKQGKVRDIYDAGEDELLIVASDRLSAFDVVLPDPIPGKGAVLTALSNFWFEKTEAIVANHLIDRPLASVISDEAECKRVEGQAIVAQKLEPLTIEAIVRGYIVGSGWKDYQETGAVCGVRLPSGLQVADCLPQPIFTPSTKADVGDHDENITFDDAVGLVGGEIAEEVRRLSISIYTEASAFAAKRGIIIADTKMEFGLDRDGRLVLIDELLTPDSSRFWPASIYQPGQNPPSFDKQFVRDWLEEQGWDKKPPAPRLPPDVIAKTSDKYREAQEWLMSDGGGA